jgi:hypothetical protein
MDRPFTEQPSESEYRTLEYGQNPNTVKTNVAFGFAITSAIVGIAAIILAIIALVKESSNSNNDQFTENQANVLKSWTTKMSFNSDDLLTAKGFSDNFTIPSLREQKEQKTSITNFIATGGNIISKNELTDEFTAISASGNSIVINGDTVLMSNSDATSTTNITPTKITTPAFQTDSFTFTGPLSVASLTTAGSVTVGSGPNTITLDNTGTITAVNVNTTNLTTGTLSFTGALTVASLITPGSVTVGSGPNTITLDNTGIATCPTLNTTTINSGTWNANIITPAKGGTGSNLSATGGANQVLQQSTLGGNITVAQLSAANLSNGTSGSGALLLATSPTLITPNLGTPSAGTLTNCTGLPLSTGTTGTLSITNGGTGSNLSATGGANQVLQQSTLGGNITVAQLSAANLSNGTSGSGALLLATSPTLITPNLGTPSAGTLTNCTGLPLSTGTTGTLSITNGGTGSNLSATGGANQVLQQSTLGGNITVAQLSAANLSNGTSGSGALLLATSPTLITPNLGTPTSGNLINCTGLPLSTGPTGILSITNGGTGSNLSATGGVNQVLQQSTLGGNITVAQLSAANLSNGTSGSGALLLATSPTLITPDIGTPSAGTLTNCTGLPLSTGTTGTLSVANGGTGVTSVSAYTVVCGGTTSTDPLQTIPSIGIAGQVLTSNGPGILPSFQTSAAAIPSGYYTPTASDLINLTQVTFPTLPIYIEIGTKVLVYGTFNVQVSAAAIKTFSFQMSVPVAPSGNFTNQNQAQGTGTIFNITANTTGNITFVAGAAVPSQNVQVDITTILGTDSSVDFMQGTFSFVYDLDPPPLPILYNYFLSTNGINSYLYRVDFDNHSFSLPINLGPTTTHYCLLSHDKSTLYLVTVDGSDPPIRIFDVVTNTETGSFSTAQLGQNFTTLNFTCIDITFDDRYLVYTSQTLPIVVRSFDINTATVTSSVDTGLLFSDARKLVCDPNLYKCYVLVSGNGGPNYGYIKVMTNLNTTPLFTQNGPQLGLAGQEASSLYLNPAGDKFYCVVIPVAGAPYIQSVDYTTLANISTWIIPDINTAATTMAFTPDGTRLFVSSASATTPSVYECLTNSNTVIAHDDGAHLAVPGFCVACSNSLLYAGSVAGLAVYTLPAVSFLIQPFFGGEYVVGSAQNFSAYY